MDNVMGQYGTFENWVNYVREQQKQGKMKNINIPKKGNPPKITQLNQILKDGTWSKAYWAWAKEQHQEVNIRFLLAVEEFRADANADAAHAIKDEYLQPPSIEDEGINLYDDIMDPLINRINSLPRKG
jgi:hypothetical protein